MIFGLFPIPQRRGLKEKRLNFAQQTLEENAMKVVRLAAAIGLQSVLAASVWAASHGDHSGQGHGHNAAMQKMSGTIQNMPLADNVAVNNCWLRLLPGSAPSAGYFLLQNNRPDNIVVVGAATDAFNDVMVHQTRQENGLSRMVMVSEVVVEAGQKLEFKPGGYHLMLEKPNREVQVGDTVGVSIALKSGEKVAAKCEVKPAATVSPTAHMSH